MLKKLVFICFTSFLLGKGDLPLPRFASLRSNKVNTHVGPGKQYPIEWCYERQHMPVEIIAEFENWRQLRDHDGAMSWVHVSLLSGHRFGIITKQTRVLREKPEDKSKAMANLDPNVIVALKKIQGEWIQVESRSEKGKFLGWLKNSEIWGTYPHEVKF